ncbi:hypothetical protein [Methylobacterium persicinum]|nr:hypothetical protein [Methylobacterium persicinum]GJE38384.1 hypothetical protein KHHGKMAE_2456 [Methylobacterium persicinum]
MCLVVLFAAATPAIARLSPNAPAHETELGLCRAHAAELAPPGTQIPDRGTFCACYADGAVEARLWELENAEANVGQDVQKPVAERTISLRDAKAAKVVSDCLKH